MRCPSCDSPVLILELSEIEVDHCPECEGVWFDEGELETLLTTPEAIAAFKNALLPDLAPKDPLRKCPICRKKMSKILYESRIHLDLCPENHGIWFDHGELKTILEDLESEGRGSKVASHLKSVFGKTSQDT